MCGARCTMRGVGGGGGGGREKFIYVLDRKVSMSWGLRSQKDNIKTDINL